MRDELFKDLLTSVEEAADVAGSASAVGRLCTYKGKVLVEIRNNEHVEWSLASAAEALVANLPSAGAPSSGPSVRFIRESLNQTQEGFAHLLGASVDTVRGWEQGKRSPRGPAKTLLSIAARNPMAVLQASGVLEEA